MTNYSILSAKKVLGPYDGIVKARAAAIRAIKEGRPSVDAAPYGSAVMISMTKDFRGPEWKYPVVSFFNPDGRFYWKDRQNESSGPSIVNADGTLRRA